MSPSGPTFEVDGGGFISFVPDHPRKERAKLLAIVNAYFEKVTVYDREGRKWSGRGIEGPSRKSWWTKLLANTVYNPWVTVTVVWQEPKPYEIEELKSVYTAAVDKDDDILTQFVDANELKSRIDQADTFDELVETYRWMQTEQDEAESE